MAPSGDDQALLTRNVASMRAAFELMTRSSPGGRWLELPGVAAMVVPAVPERSVFNSVLYDDAAALREALGTLAAAYEEAGIDAWTVWAPEFDHEAAAALESAGHVLDAAPAAMMLDLEGFKPLPAGDLDWTGEGDPAELAGVNDRAYPYPNTPFSRGLAELPPGAARIYVARHDGRPAASVMTLDHDGDCCVYWVAVAPEARGHGLSGRLLGRALADARERGCTTSSLQATKMGKPVYAKLGYRDLGALHMWERRAG